MTACTPGTIEVSLPRTLDGNTTNELATTGHTHEVRKASTTAAGIVQLEDSLTSTSTQKALTANQGKVLAEAITAAAQTEARFVNDAGGSTQQDINDFGGAKWRNKTGGYALGYTVKLNNGDSVKSTINANTNDPNVTMTGWVKTNDASQIFDASGKTQQQVNNGLASIAEMLAIANPKTDMRVHVNSYNAPNYALAKPHYGGGTFIYDANKSTTNDDGLVLKGWVRQNYSVLKPEFWGADPNNQVDCSSAFNKCFAAAKGLAIELDGHYKFTSTIVVDYADTGTLKMYGQGSGMHNGQNGIQRTVLNFDALPAGSVAITFKRIRGLKLSDFHITHSTSFDDASTTCWITTLDDFEIERVTLKNTNGASSTGFRFGLTDGTDCAFMGTVKNCEINMLRGRATAILAACTSINHINCYQQGGYFYSYKSQYCLYQNCASEGSPSFGYIAEDTKSLTYVSCAGEANAQGVFTVKRGCSNIEYISPYGAANKGVYGTLLFIDGSVGYNANIRVSNPVSISNPNAQFDIYSDGANGILEVSNVYKSNLSKNIGGSATWKENCLIATGDNVIDDTFTVTLNNFTATTQPSATAIYTRSGRKVEIVIKITPSVSTTTDANSTITIPTFGGIRLDSVANVVGQNNTNYGNCMVYTNGKIQMPVISGGFSNPLFIKATLVTDHAVA